MRGLGIVLFFVLFVVFYVLQEAGRGAKKGASIAKNAWDAAKQKRRGNNFRLNDVVNTIDIENNKTDINNEIEPLYSNNYPETNPIKCFFDAYNRNTPIALYNRIQYESLYLLMAIMWADGRALKEEASNIYNLKDMFITATKQLISGKPLFHEHGLNISLYQQGIELLYDDAISNSNNMHEKGNLIKEIPSRCKSITSSLSKLNDLGCPTSTFIPAIIQTLIEIAMVDNHLDSSEEEMLFLIGRELSYSQVDIMNMIQRLK
tara:strand:+ start:5655 stop:6440 length:786 start_codon:yes stop_codon:yes gene_type:complete